MIKHGAIAIIAVSLRAASSLAGETGASEWAKGQLSSARLISAGGFDGGSYKAALEITLKGNAHTYWRNPGDAGAPPVFVFDGSDNLASATPRFPAPKRIVEDGSDVFGYVGRVMIPIDVAPRDPVKPVSVALVLRYAACEKICVPAEARLSLNLTPSAAPTALAPDIADAIKSLPKPIAIGGPAMTATRKIGPVKPTWNIAFDPTSTGASDLFSEAAEGWFFDTRRAADGTFDLILEEKPAEAATPVTVDLTYVDGPKAFATSIRLDASAATP
jgi:DsbC/DsbD-like thiol-disulfide interchange protein